MILRVRAVIGVALGEERNVCWRQSRLQEATQQQIKGGQMQMRLLHGTPAELGDGGSPSTLVLHPKSIAPSATNVTTHDEKGGGWQWLVYDQKVNTGGRETWASGVTSTPPLSLLILTFLPPVVIGLANADSFANVDGETVDASVRLTSTACSALNVCCSKRAAALLLCLHSAIQHRLIRAAEKGRGWQLNRGLLSALSQLLREPLAPVAPRR